MATTDPLTELDNLRLFLQERVQAFDSSIDTSTGSVFDSQVITPLIQRLSPDPYNTPIRDFIIGRLATEFPDLVLQDGEPIDDYAVKIMQILLEAFRRQIKQVSLNQSLANPDQLNENEADNLAANFFARRRLGGYAVGVARLYYTSPQYALVTPSNAVYDAAGHRFFPVESQAIMSDRMLFNEENGLYYFEVVARAEKQGTDYNIDPKTSPLVGVEGLPSVVKVVNKIAFSEGDDKETTEAFLSRVEAGLTEKSLVTLRGIRARLLEVFASIRLIQVVGFGDPEMNRDIVKGSSQTSPYAHFIGITSAGQSYIDLNLSTSYPLITSEGVTHTDFVSGGVLVGDIIEMANLNTGVIESFKVLGIQAVGVIPAYTRLLMDGVYANTFPSARFIVRRPTGVITISDIPGGILVPTTQAGNIEISDGEVHIGGALDVFVRAGDLQQQDTTLTGILDGKPLHFGLELESFGDATLQRVHITEKFVNIAAVPNEDRFGTALPTPLDQLVINVLNGDELVSDGTCPWFPTTTDKGRYVQLLGGNSGPDFGTFKILDVLDREYFKDNAGRWHIGVRIQLDVTLDYESGSTGPTFLTHTTGSGQGAFDLSLRVLEDSSIKDRVRDRDNSTVVIPADSPNPGNPVIEGGADFGGLGAKIGDSVVIETGDDAGIYSIRRVLSWLATNDTLLLDRALTRSLTPSGSTTGLRYRIADELNIDLVAPKVTKIPLGSIFLGDDLSTVAGSTVVSVSGSTNFLLAGVEAGDILEILEGDNAGKYTVKEVTGTTATLATTTANLTFSQKFSVYRAFTGVSLPMIRVKTVELLDSNSQPTGITIPYGDPVDARILGTLSNRAEGKIIESYAGELEDNGGLYYLHDPSIDFVSEGVVAGYRLNILSGNSVGNYYVVQAGSPSVNHLQVMSTANGGTAFRIEEINVHYSIGLPSTGYLRLYFLEPTSVEISTGLAGGRVQYDEAGSVKPFFFSQGEGYTVVPSEGSGEAAFRDLRVVHSSGNKSILELTDTTKPSVFQLELQDGDVVGIHEPLQFGASADLPGTFTWNGTTTVSTTSIVGLRVGMKIALKSDTQLFEVSNIGGSGPYTVTILNPYGAVIPTGATTTERVATFEQLGLFGAPAGLRTTAGSNLVTVPDNSLIDFVAMNRNSTLIGQTLIIDSGPDTGQYIIEAVVSAKKLRLSALMTSSTETILGGDVGAPIRNATLAADGAMSRITDTVDGSQLKNNIIPGYYITIFESTRGDLDGSWEVADLLTSPSVPNTIKIDTQSQVNNQASTFASLDPFSIGLFSWVKTATKTNLEQAFRIYKVVAVDSAITQVATKRVDSVGVRRGIITAGTTLQDADTGFTVGALRGDMVEILTGPSAGVYTLAANSVGNVVTIYGYTPFPVVMSNVPYRVWGGLHGSTRMVTVGTYKGTSGMYYPGEQMPYSIRRTTISRVGSTSMSTSFDGLLYYVDVPIESLGAGDDLNLSEGTRIVVVSGVRVDGYTYKVENNNLTFSPFEEVSLIFDRRFLPVGNSDSPENLTEVSGRNIRIIYENSTPTKLVDDLLRSDTDRPINANPIARHFLPSFVFSNFEYSGGASVSEAGKDMEDYINTLGAQSELEISDLESFLTKRGATYVRHPISLVTITHDLDRSLVVDRSEDKLGGLNKVPFNGTGRIACFFAKVGEGLTLVRES